MDLAHFFHIDANKKFKRAAVPYLLPQLSLLFLQHHWIIKFVPDEIYAIVKCWKEKITVKNVPDSRYLTLPSSYFLFDTYFVHLQGIFKILSLNGSFNPLENGLTNKRYGGLTIWFELLNGDARRGALASSMIAIGPMKVTLVLEEDIV